MDVSSLPLLSSLLFCDPISSRQQQLNSLVGGVLFVVRLVVEQRHGDDDVVAC